MTRILLWINSQRLARLKLREQRQPVLLDEKNESSFIRSTDFSSKTPNDKLLKGLSFGAKQSKAVWERRKFPYPIHRIRKWQTRGKKLGPSHESEALEGKQKLQMKTFSELAECLARIPPKITLYGLLFKYNYVGCLLLLMFSIDLLFAIKREAYIFKETGWFSWFHDSGWAFTLPLPFFFCSRSKFRAITRLETLATQATPIVQCSWHNIITIFSTWHQLHYTLPGHPF